MLQRKFFYIIRHCESVANRDSFISGQYDVALTDTGQAQAKNLAESLMSISPPPDYIVSSSLQRAYQTAAYMNRKAYLPLVSDDFLREQYFGDLQGVFKADIHDLSQALMHPPGGESEQEFESRVLRTLNHYLAKSGTPLFCCHGGVFRILARHTGCNCEQPDNAQIYALTPSKTGNVLFWYIEKCF